MIIYLLKEQFRMVSDIYDGLKILLFPIFIFGITTLFLTQTSIVEANENSLAYGLIAISFIAGAMVGSVNFSAEDMLKNLLGKRGYLVYSSRVLPVSKTRLFFLYIVGELLFFSLMFFAPFYVSIIFFTSFDYFYYVLIILAPLMGVVFAYIISKVVGLWGSGLFVDYGEENFRPVVERTLIDVLRSGGGFSKVIATYLFLIGVYWILQVSYLDSYLVLSSIFLGLVSLSVYNWVNRFDSWNDYSHLPMSYQNVVKDKFIAYLLISILLNTLAIIIIFQMIGGPLLAAIVTNMYVLIFLGGLTGSVLGLNPNTKIYDFKVYTEYLFLILMGVLPLMVLSIFVNDFYDFNSSITLSFYTLLVLISFTGLLGVKNTKL